MTTTQNTDETFDFMNSWEEDTVRDEVEFAEYDTDESESGYKEMRNTGMNSKRKDEWRNSKKSRDKSRREERNMKRASWD